MTQYISMSYEKFIEQFTLVQNTYNEQDGFDGAIFGIMGPSYEIVESTDPAHVWTMTYHFERNSNLIRNGFHPSVASLYLITYEPAPKDTVIVFPPPE